MATTAAESSMSGGTLAGVRPVPTDEEAAAIVAALQLTTTVAAPSAGADVASWRFSGRWWSQPIPLRRPRPWT